MGAAQSVCRFSLREVVERLQWLVSLEQFSPLTGAAALVVDLDASPVSPAALERAAERLLELPCVTVGAVASPELGATALARRLDVIVVTDTQLGSVLDGIVRQPLAAAALAQLLRMGDALDVGEALVAESLVYSTLQSGPDHARWRSAQSRPQMGASDPDPSVLVARDGARLDLVLNRPQRHNAYSAAMRDELVAGLEVAAADASIETIVLSGRGPSFCAGGDLAEFGTLPDPATAHAVRSARNAARLLARLGDRVRAEVHGACIGAGIELAAFAGRVVAREGAFFQLPEVSMGLVPGAGGTASLPRRIGRQRTAYMAFAGERIDARTALEWRLVDEIIPF